jgi:hypothetical protein
MAQRGKLKSPATKLGSIDEAIRAAGFTAASPVHYFIEADD